MSENIQIFSLRQVVLSIKKTIEDRYQSTYWVKAEMHKLNKYASGHCFPELLEKVDGKVVAEMRATIWAHNFERINKRFIEIVKEPLKEDTQLLLLVKVSFHETFGVGLQVMDIDPNYSLGELQREKQETLRLLKKEGVYSNNQNLLFPILPKRIAVISSSSSKGLSDFENILKNNEHQYSFSTFLFTSYLQGDQAAESIINALHKISKVKHHFDAVVIIRGGGGEVGLSCFNNFNLCREIALFPLPILTGIGHSTNYTVAEMVSYQSAITPTELADVFVNAFVHFDRKIDDLGLNIKHFSLKFLSNEKNVQKLLVQNFRRSTNENLQSSTHQLKSKLNRLSLSVKYAIGDKNRDLKHSFQVLGINSSRLLSRENELINSSSENLIKFSPINLSNYKGKLEDMEKMVQLTDPRNVLKRGYSISTINGKLLQNIDPKIGDIIKTQYDSGSIESEITKQNEQENN